MQLGGITGDVIDMGVLRTTLMKIGQWVRGDLYNGRILWGEIVIPVKYGCNQ